MAILKVAQLGHPVLRHPARHLTPDEIRSDSIQGLVSDMRETMLEYEGVGLAAPQVHQSVRVAVVEFDSDNRRYDIAGAEPGRVFFNASVTVLDPTPLGTWEGCLSVEGLRGYVERPSKVRVDYLDQEARPQSLEAEGFMAIVLQHEFDHLDGVLYVDRIADPHKFAFIEEFMRHHKGDRQ